MITLKPSMTVDQVRTAALHERMAWRHVELLAGAGPLDYHGAVRVAMLRITRTGSGLMARVGAR